MLPVTFFHALDGGFEGTMTSIGPATFRRQETAVSHGFVVTMVPHGSQGEAIPPSPLASHR